METNQSTTNQNPTDSELQPQQTASNNKLFVVVAISILLSSMVAGSAVYFWQKSVNDKTVGSLEQKITSLEEQVSVMKKTTATPESTLPSVISPTPTTEPTTNLKTYINEKYGFSFDYPQAWIMEKKDDGDRVSFSNIAEGHTINVMVWRATGFGYCYKYGKKKDITVGGKTAETADGVGPSEMCDKPEEYTNRGNTFVLIPLEDKSEGLPTNQIHISYNYPLDDINLAKTNLNQILSTLEFTK